MRVIFCGATRGMGRALARRYALRGATFHLLGRRPEDLEATAEDLMVRGARGEVRHGHLDLEDADSIETGLEQAFQRLGGADLVVLTAGLFATQEALETDPTLAERLTRVNFTNSVLFCEAAKKRLLAQAPFGTPPSRGTLCVFSSVAGERGRRPVVIYGASKAGLTRYLEGLDHRHRRDGLTVITVKPGFVKTGMTAGLRPPPFAGEPEAVAKRVEAAIEARVPVVYAPAPWAAVMAVIRQLPRGVMRRVAF